MDSKRRTRRDFLQNIIITLLSLTAVALIAQSQLYNLGDNGYFQQFLSTDVEQTEAPQQTDTPASPVRVAVTGTYGRYGDVDLTTSSEDFHQLGSLLGEALGSAQANTACSAQDFTNALSRPSLYYDFLSPLPLSMLATETGASVSDDTLVRCLLLADSGANSVQLFFWDGEASFRVCSTAVTVTDLEALISQYEQGNAFFAADRAELDPAFEAVAPWSLLLQTVPELPILSAQPMQTDTDTLLTSLKFNPRTNYRYPEASGTEVIVEGDRSVRIHPDGTVLYLSSGEPTLSIDAHDPDAPTLSEAISEAGALVGTLLSDTGDAAVYLQDISQNDTSTVLRYGYQMNGVPIYFADGGCAAEVTLSGSTVLTMTLRLRTYAVTSDLSSLLPLTQTLAIAAQNSGAELSIGYTDSGASTVSGCWLSDD